MPPAQPDRSAMQALTEAMDAVEPLVDIARGLVAALYWWGVDRDESAVGRFGRPDPEAITIMAVPILDYSTRAALALRRAQDTLR
jgi:hypothetical protein